MLDNQMPQQVCWLLWYNNKRCYYQSLSYVINSATLLSAGMFMCVFVSSQYFIDMRYLCDNKKNFFIILI